jgi:CYTH domain-containing protein
MTNTGNRDIEIEARFLAYGDGWRGQGTAVEIYQGYLATDETMAMRIRLAEGNATLTIKGTTRGLTRKEFEFALNDVQKAKKVIEEFCSHPIEKIRHTIEHGGFLWEVDEYGGENEGLVIAEIEFEHEEDYGRMLALGKPPWVGLEITRDAWQYTNARLSVQPFSSWSADEKKDMQEHAAGRASEVLE